MLHFLCDHADIGLIAAVVTEPVETESIVEMPEKDDVVLEPDIGSSSATASTTTPTTTEATPAAATTTTGPHTAAARVRPTAASCTHMGRPGWAAISGGGVMPCATSGTLCRFCRTLRWPRLRNWSIGLTAVRSLRAVIWSIAFASVS
jgi:hypothetical protein